MIENHTIKINEDSLIIFALHSTISNNPSLESYFHLLILSKENRTIGISSAHVENNPLLSLLFNLTLDAASKVLFTALISLNRKKLMQKL